MTVESAQLAIQDIACPVEFVFYQIHSAVPSILTELAQNATLATFFIKKPAHPSLPWPIFIFIIQNAAQKSLQNFKQKPTQPPHPQVLELHDYLLKMNILLILLYFLILLQYHQLISQILNHSYNLSMNYSEHHSALTLTDFNYQKAMGSYKPRFEGMP